MTIKHKKMFPAKKFQDSPDNFKEFWLGHLREGK